ncbi:MAG TPA: DNA repair protein RecN, partial [Spirochaetia bacterium]|nr:DNA repair protein RecN [Spirochaetia bacterium]
KPERQRQVLDRYAGLDEKLAAYTNVYTELCSLQRQLEIIEHDDAQEERETELLAFAVKEISEANISANEENLLQEEENRLSQYEKLYASVSSLHEIFSDHEGIIAKLRKATTILEHVGTLDPKLSSISESVTNSYYELEEAARNISTYLDKLSFDPDRLEKIEERLALLQKLKKKYGKTVEDVIKYKEEAEKRLEAFAHRGDDIEILKKKITEKEKLVYELADELSKQRNFAKKTLEEKILSILHTLGMPHAVFSIKMGRKPLDNGKIVVGPYGYDEPEFLISANKGEPLKPLSLVVSGGELARIMLAVKTVLAMADDIPTLIFDEVDTGIGGEVVVSVGKHLFELSRTKQVLCITHLAVIAAKADNHYKVEKYIEKDRTATRLQKMPFDARVKEIARMLAGDSAGEAALLHARTLLEDK